MDARVVVYYEAVDPVADGSRRPHARTSNRPGSTNWRGWALRGTGRSDGGLVRGHTWVVGAEVVQHDMDRPAGIVRDHLIHERQELLSSAPFTVHPPDRASEDVECRKERRGAVALVLMAHTADGLTVGQAKVTAGTSNNSPNRRRGRPYRRAGEGNPGHVRAPGPVQGCDGHGPPFR